MTVKGGVCIGKGKRGICDGLCCRGCHVGGGWLGRGSGWLGRGGGKKDKTKRK